MSQSAATGVPEGFGPFQENVLLMRNIGPLYSRIEGEGDARSLVIGFHVDEPQLNIAGICHGGIIMTVLDMVVGGTARLRSGRNVFPPTINLTVDFLRPGLKGDWLEGRPDFVRVTRTMGFASALMFGPKGPVARANGIAKLPEPEDDRIGMPKGLPGGDA